MLATIDRQLYLPETDIARLCRYERYDPQYSPWESVSEAVMAIEEENFKEHAESEEKMRAIFQNPNGIIVTVRSPFEDNRVVGISAVIPAEDEYSFPDSEFRDRLTDPDFAIPHTMYVHVTQIATSHQGKGIIALLNPLTLSLVTQTGIPLLERDAAHAPRKGKTETYAEQLAKTYQDQVLAFTPHPSKFGPQAFIRMSLVAQASPPLPIY